MPYMEINSLHFSELNSTNDWSKENYPQFDRKKLTLVTADAQLKGRGRMERKWISPSKLNIYATFTLFIEMQKHSVGNIPQILALSAVGTLNSYALNAQIKWPNDVLIHGKKIAGILCETIMEEKQLVIVIGIGLNVNMSKENLDVLDKPATSMFIENEKKYEIQQVLEILSQNFNNNLEIFLKKGFSPFLEEYKTALVHTRDDAISIDGKICTFQSVNDDGSITIQLENGQKKTCVTGEIFS